MKSANAFSYAISGSFTDEAINKYAQYVNNTTAMFQNASGWLGEQAKKTMSNFDTFLNSRAWEMGKRLLGKNDGEYVSRYSIGYLGNLESIQQAEGYMRDYIMAHPVLHQMYLDEEIEGYGGEFSHFCAGVGADNLFYRRSMNGLLNLEMIDETAHLRHTHYHDTLGGQLTFRERVDVQKTWAAVNHHLAGSLFDLTSAEGNKRKSAQEPPADK